MKILGTLFILAFVAWGGTEFYLHITLNRNISGYIKQAADANTIEIAKEPLKLAVDNAKRFGYTQGFTSILYTSPSEDVGYWFRNLSGSLLELDKVDPNNAAAASMVLSKLRQTLLDHGKDGESPTIPPGLAEYPFNLLFALWGWLSFILGGISVLVSFFTLGGNRPSRISASRR